ncbi:neuromedin-U receptor 2-like [Amphiura filiformis]|uniref:neuromedin-U receptor 2-like n=1 Tax=Amphiura filiformis TaxID=82378 RepID=UPI003B215271
MANLSCTPQSTINLTSPEDTLAVLYNTFDTILVTVIMPFIMIVGHIGNFGFLFVMFRVKPMRTVTNFYLTHLAVSDICFLSIAVGEKLWRYFLTPVTFDQSAMTSTGCILLYLFMDNTFFASLMLVTLVSVEKYCSICLPLKHLKLSGKKRTVTLINVAWFIALAFASCTIPGSSVMVKKCVIWAPMYDDLPPIVGQCQHISETWQIAYQGIQTIPFFGCLVINKVLYAKIILRLHRRATLNPTLTRQGTPHTNPILLQRNQMAHMLIITGMLFSLCLAPFQLLSFMNMISFAVNDENMIQDPHVESIVYNICRMLVYLNSAINPIVYNVTNARYRRSFKDAFSCNDEARRRRYRSNMSTPQISRQNSGKFDTGSRTITADVGGHLTTIHESIRSLECPD